MEVDAAHPRAKALTPKARRLAQGFLEELGLSDVELSIALVGDRAIRRLNRAWRKKDEATDVLSFPAGKAPRGAPGPWAIGDVVISLDTAARRAREEGRSIHQELALYLAHGLLHLLGYDHLRAADARRMGAMEERLLGGAGMLAAAGRP